MAYNKLSPTLMVSEDTAGFILVAEDNESDIFLIREALKEENLERRLHVIGDGEAALAFIDQLDADLNRSCPEVVLLDLHLPKHDGQAILSRLRGSERCSRIPVVVLTSSLSDADKRNVERHSQVHFFRKPSSLDQFMALGPVVRNAIAGGASK